MCVQNIDRGCLVVGIVSALHETGFTLTLLALDGDVSRDIADLKIQVGITIFYQIRRVFFLLIVLCNWFSTAHAL